MLFVDKTRWIYLVR